MAHSHSIHEFSHPPVVETVLSIQFAPLQKFLIPHFGLYWDTIRSEYPQFQVQPPLGQVREEFSPRPKRGAPLGLELVTEPTFRCWFLDTTGNRLLQLQRDRFIYNWRKVDGEEVYPRYQALRSTFEAEWSKFCHFLEVQSIGKPDVNQCEITYVNHIEYGKGWSSFGELNQVIQPWSGSYSGGFLPAPEKMNLNVIYAFPDSQGRLHITMAPVIRARDGKEVLQFNLTARGAIASCDLGDITRTFDTCRTWIVEGFVDFTTPAMHRLWGRTK